MSLVAIEMLENKQKCICRKRSHQCTITYRTSDNETPPFSRVLIGRH